MSEFGAFPWRLIMIYERSYLNVSCTPFHKLLALHGKILTRPDLLLIRYIRKSLVGVIRFKTFGPEQGAY